MMHEVAVMNKIGWPDRNFDSAACPSSSARCREFPYMAAQGPIRGEPATGERRGIDLPQAFEESPQLSFESPDDTESSESRPSIHGRAFVAGSVDE